MIPIAAYADRLSVRPGETIRFHIANATGAPLDADVVRVISADANPAGPGIRTEPVGARLGKGPDAMPQRVPRGSYMRVDGIEPHLGQGSFTLVFRFLSTLPGVGAQVLASRGVDSQGFALTIDRSARLGVQVAGNDGPIVDTITNAILQPTAFSSVK